MGKRKLGVEEWLVLAFVSMYTGAKTLFTGRIHFLMPNQQCQCTEGTKVKIRIRSILNANAALLA